MNKISAKYAKFENILAVFFVAFLALFPLVTKICQSVFNVIILNNENVMVNLVFVFSCIAGAITWREDRHISLASLTDLFPEKVTKENQVEVRYALYYFSSSVSSEFSAFSVRLRIVSALRYVATIWSLSIIKIA